MSVYIPNELRKLVRQRALNTCEYCLVHEDNTFLDFHIDHIISLKHGGTTTEDNLAFTCATCNRHKGTDLGSFLNDPSKIIRFYHPRTDQWLNHFSIDGPYIKGKTAIGKVTLKIFHLNDEHRILERNLLIETNDFPSTEAQKLINSSI